MAKRSTPVPAKDEREPVEVFIWSLPDGHWITVPAEQAYTRSGRRKPDQTLCRIAIEIQTNGHHLMPPGGT